MKSAENIKNMISKKKHFLYNMYYLIKYLFKFSKLRSPLTSRNILKR